MTIRFEPPTYDGGRRLLMCGQIQAGAVFPPADNKDGEWRWMLWIGGALSNQRREGHAKSEISAKNTLMAALEDWLRKAGLEATHA